MISKSHSKFIVTRLSNSYNQPQPDLTVKKQQDHKSSTILPKLTLSNMRRISPGRKTSRGNKTIWQSYQDQRRIKSSKVTIWTLILFLASKKTLTGLNVIAVTSTNMLLGSFQEVGQVLNSLKSPMIPSSNSLLIISNFNMKNIRKNKMKRKIRKLRNSILDASSANLQ